MEYDDADLISELTRRLQILLTENCQLVAVVKKLTAKVTALEAENAALKEPKKAEE